MAENDNKSEFDAEIDLAVDDDAYFNTDDGGSDGPEPRDAIPDPGFVAFADDLDDPLANWPSPDSRLEDLPELQLPEEPDGNPGAEAVTAVEDAPPLGLDDEKPATPEPPYPEPIINSDTHHDSDSDKRVSIFDQEDDLIEDFLNDLDTAESPELSPKLAAGATAGASVARTFSANTAAGSSTKPTERFTTTGRDTNVPPQSFPIWLVLALVIGVALLAFGGYGLARERGELQAEIRDLQARLAVSSSVPAVASETESVTLLEAENNRLRSELEALEREQVVLTNRLEAFEAEVRVATVEAPAESAGQPNDLAPASARSATPSPEIPRDSWFVNFGSFSKREVAERWARDIDAKGGRVAVQPMTTSAGATLYRVRVVGITTKAEAERLSTQLEQQFDLQRLWVGNGS